MKKSILLFNLVFWICFPTQAQEDYVLKINGKEYGIELDKDYEILVNNQKTSLVLSMNDTLTYDDELFSFEYPKEYKVGKTNFDDIEQIMIMTAEGSGFMIQKYDSFSPEGLEQFILNEVMRESIDYGYELTRELNKKKLKSGQEIEISKATLTYKTDKNVYEVVSISGRDEGIIILTMVMDETFSEQGHKIINMMWDSLVYKK